MTEPKIRFPEYNDEWIEYPLEDILAENLDPVATPREGYRRVGIYCHAKGTFQEDVPADKVLDVDTMYKIHKDNLIVNITFAWEHAIAIVKPEDEGMLVSHRFPEYEFNKGHVPSFYKYLILRPYMKNQLSLASPGGAGRNRVLNKKQFMQIPVYVPCENEQQKIADFLSNVDDVIAASEEEVANLEKQKKAMMQKIFSQEVRFKREDGSDFSDWEEKTLGVLGNFYGGLTGKTKNDFGSGEGKYITYMNVNRNLFIKNDILENVVVKDDEKQNVVSFGDLIFTQSSETVKECGLTSVYLYNDKPYLNSFCMGFKLNNLTYTTPIYMGYLMRSRKVRNQIMIQAQGISRINLSGNRILNILIDIPHPDEQQLIADFLTSYDEAIKAAKQELEKWKELKKGLLQQMFV